MDKSSYLKMAVTERRLLVKTSEDQDELAIAAVVESDDGIRYTAFKRLANSEQETFRKVALGDSNCRCRLEAIKRLHDSEQETFKKIVFKERHPDCRNTALSRLTKKNLVEVARHVGLFGKCRIFFRLLRLRLAGDTARALPGPAKEARLAYEKNEVTPMQKVAIEGAITSYENSSVRTEKYSERESLLEKQVRELRELIEAAKKEREAILPEDENVYGVRLDKNIASMEHSLSALSDVLTDTKEAKKEEQDKTAEANAVFERAVRSAKAQKAILDMEERMRSWGDETTKILTHMKTT